MGMPDASTVGRGRRARERAVGRRESVGLWIGNGVDGGGLVVRQEHSAMVWRHFNLISSKITF